MNNDPVSSTCPGSNCSLRQAVSSAASGDTVSLPAATYTLSQGQINIDKSLTVAGASSQSTTITTSTIARLFQVGADGNANFTGIDFMGGIAATPPGATGEGGAILNQGSAALTDDAFTNNSAVGNPQAGTVGGEGGAGGAISNRGSMTIANCSFSSNRATGGGAGTSVDGLGGTGGAIVNRGALVVTASEFNGNIAQAGKPASGHSGGGGGFGGAIETGGPTTVSSSIFGKTAANSAEGGGVTASTPNGLAGAIAEVDTHLTLKHDTFGASEAGGSIGSSPSTPGPGGQGGALWGLDGRISIADTTFSGPVADGGVEPASGTLPGGLGGEGGAIFVNQASVSIARTAFNNTIAAGGTAGTSTVGLKGLGGAIYEQDSSLTIVGSSFAGDQARHGGDNGTSGGDGGRGGAIEGDHGSLQISGSAFTSNQTTGSSHGGSAGDGGAIDAPGGTSMTVTSSKFTGNSVQVAGSNGGAGGAIFAQDPAPLLVGDRFQNNSAPGDGLGGALEVKSADVVGSTFDGNSTDEGGAIDANDLLIVVNSTITGNTTTTDGGGIQSEESLVLENVTLAGNSTGSGGGGNLYLSGSGTTTLHNTVIVGGSASGNTGTANCSIGTGVMKESFNLEDRNQCGFHGTGDQVNVSAPHLSTLRDNGGPLPTIALLPGSPAINAGDPGGCTDEDGSPLLSDQRGVPRPQGARCDIGAFEFARPSITIARPTNGSTFTLGQRVLASFSCNEAATPGLIASCRGTVPSGHAIDTGPTGRHSFTVTATDKAGVTTSVIAHYRVIR